MLMFYVTATRYRIFTWINNFRMLFFSETRFGGHPPFFRGCETFDVLLLKIIISTK